MEAERRGCGIQFAAAVSRLLFGGTSDWDRGDHLRQAVASLGLDLDAMDAAIVGSASHAEQVQANQRAQSEAGHTGAPLFVYNNEPFFGQDRMQTLCWRLAQDGLNKPLE